MQLSDIIKRVKQIEISAKKRTNSQFSGEYHSAFKGQGMIFSEVRPYQSGDDIRQMDWNKTAQFQSPFVKVMEEERELSVVFLVDVSASMDYGTKYSLKKEFIAEICASLGFSAIANGDKVGLLLFSDKTHTILPAKKGKKHLLAMISQILAADYYPAKVNSEGLSKSVLNLFKRKSLVFIFSDFNDDWDKKSLGVLSKKHQVFGVKVSDEKDQTIPDIGIAKLEDTETGETVWVDTSSPQCREWFSQIKQEQTEKIERLFEQCSAPFLSLKTGENYLPKFQQIFKK